ncbi:MAG: hypothetical protein H7A36_07680 [Chlamydiales bacterium]|nr:hypothetical protein [Chlamydiales bacterium]
MVVALAIAIFAGFVAGIVVVGMGRHYNNVSLMKTGFRAAFGTIGAGVFLILPIHCYGEHVYKMKLKEVQGGVD